MYTWLDITALEPEEAKISVLGIPFDGGQTQEPGAAKGPAKVREFAEKFMPGATDDWHVLEYQPLVYDFGDVDMRGTWGESFERVEKEAYRVMGYNNFNIFIGGDHSVTIPLQKAFKRKHTGEKIGIIHFDSHPELCDCYDGKIWSHANTAKRALEDVVEPEDILFLGIRAAEAEEVELMRRKKDLTVISATEIFHRGFSDCCREIYNKFKGYDAIYFTLDIAVLDPAFAPAVGTPVSGGLTSRELIEFVRFIIDKLPVTDMDIVEMAPPLDSNDITAWAVMRIIEEVFSLIDRK
ncbi:MAG: arginase family protein [Firmicutes bacterium]|nr:arginase family protein [Bacillota bacterium]